MAQQIVPVSGWPEPVGTKKAEVLVYTGPSSYVAGGDPIAAATLGWGGFDFISGGMLDSTGTYYLQPVFSGFSARTVVKILFIIASTGLEEAAGTNVSTSTARLLALGV